MNLNNMTMAQLTELHNRHAAKPVTRFATKGKAIERTQAVLPKEEATQVGRAGNKYPSEAELEWLVPNPKRSNSDSGQRAAAYWGAATVGEMLERGATRADVSWDIKKGYVQCKS